MLEEEAGVMRNAMTTRAPCGAKNNATNDENGVSNVSSFECCFFTVQKIFMIHRYHVEQT